MKTETPSMREMAEGNEEVVMEKRPNHKPFYAARYIIGVYHKPCDDGQTWGDGFMRYSGGEYSCDCGFSVDYPE